MPSHTLTLGVSLPPARRLPPHQAVHGVWECGEGPGYLQTRPGPLLRQLSVHLPVGRQDGERLRGIQETLNPAQKSPLNTEQEPYMACVLCPTSSHCCRLQAHTCNSTFIIIHNNNKYFLENIKKKEKKSVKKKKICSALWFCASCCISFLK